MARENDNHDDDGMLNVIPAGEIKAEMDSLTRDLGNLRSEMEAHKQATGLAIEERADDLQKALTGVEDITRRLEEVNAKVGQNAFARQFGQSSGELRELLSSYKAGFLEMNGDNDAREVPIGSAPQLKHLIEGVFQQSEDEEGPATFNGAKHASIAKLQAASDRVYAMDHMMRAAMKNDPSALEDYNRRGGAKSLKAYKRFAFLADEFTKAAADLIDTSTEVANWVPTQWSANLYEKIKIGLPLLNLFPEISMPTATFKLPLDLNDMEAMRVSEVTSATNADPYADTNFMNPGALSSNVVTLTAEKLRTRFWLSAEADEDTIVAMYPLINMKHNRGMGEAIEDAIINGQPTNIDTGGTHYGKANPLAAAGTDARDAWDGLRRFAAQYTGSPATSVDNSNGKATVVALRGLRAAMGEYGVDPTMVAYILGIFGYVKLLDDANVMTLDKLGPNATVATGVLGQIDGADIYVSRRIPQNANATGIIDGTTTNRTLALAVHKMACILGNRRRMTMGQQQHLASDSTELVSFWRGDFQPLYPVASVPFVGRLYNIAAA